MLTPRQAQFAFIPLAALLVSGVISLAMSMLDLGLVPDLPGAWLRAWALAFAVALPTAWVVLPAVRALLARLARAPVPGLPARDVGELG